jgi:DNA-binding PadR family transcriptional regulator
VGIDEEAHELVHDAERLRHVFRPLVEVVVDTDTPLHPARPALHLAGSGRDRDQARDGPAAPSHHHFVPALGLADQLREVRLMNRGAVDPSDPSSFLPLTPVVFHILMSLAEGDKHGYAIIVEVRERTDGEVRVGTGTLYTAIRRLLEQGLIAETESGGDDGRRRTYELLPLGREVARAEANRLRRLVGFAEERDLIPAAKD